MAIAFYCLGTLDLTGRAERKMTTTDRENWTEWIWAQYVGKPSLRSSASWPSRRDINQEAAFAPVCAWSRRNRYACAFISIEPRW